MSKYQILEGDVGEALKNIPDNSMDAILSDPPYGLGKQPDMKEMLTAWMDGKDYIPSEGGFMGKEWDSFVPSPRIWKEVYRVLKPGGSAFIFTGTRTLDLMVFSLRFAGFEIKNALQSWVYFSGMPKSTNISRGVDRAMGEKPTIVGKSPNSRKPENREGNEKGGWAMSEITITAPTTDEAKRWEGYETSLKPSWEPVIVAMKPLEGTYAENAIKHGVSGLNVGDCRIALQNSEDASSTKGDGLQCFGNPDGRFPANLTLCHHPMCESLGTEKVKSKQLTAGRRTVKWGVSEGGCSYVKGTGAKFATEDGKTDAEVTSCAIRCPCGHVWTAERLEACPECGCRKTQWLCSVKMMDDEGGEEVHASRFFYAAKVSPNERNAGCEELEDKLFGQSGGAQQAIEDGKNEYQAEGGLGLNRVKVVKNDHPTLKPLKLTEYLAKMLLPPPHVDGSPRKLLIPFSGSGSEMIGGILAGWDDITGVELMPEYRKIATHRLKYWSELGQAGFDFKVSQKKQEEMKNGTYTPDFNFGDE